MTDGARVPNRPAYLVVFTGDTAIADADRAAEFMEMIGGVRSVWRVLPALDPLTMVEQVDREWRDALLGLAKNGPGADGEAGR